MIVIVIVITIIRFIPVQEYQDDASNSLCNPYQDGCQYVGSWYVHPLHVATCWCAF